jgi:hypothetical protein
VKDSTIRLTAVVSGAALFVVGGCASGAPASPPVKAANTQVSAAASPAVAAASPAVAAASPAATQIAAAASPVATSVAAAASPAASAVASAVAQSPIQITGVQLSPTDTTIGLRNTGSTAIDLSGWMLRVGTASASLPANSRVGPGETLTVHAASGTNSGNNVYLGADAATLLTGLQPGAAISLTNPQGQAAAQFTIPRP